MAAPILGLVEPKEWLSRTSLALSRTRSPTLLKLDKAYADYFKLRSDQNRQALYQALNDYLIEKGRNWENVDRNKRSGGLMAYLHNFTRPVPLATNVLAKRIPESRHGLLYLWQNAEVNTLWAKIALEGALSVGSATVGMLQASNYNNGDAMQGAGIIADKTPGNMAANVLGGGLPPVVGFLAGPRGAGVRNPGMIQLTHKPLIMLRDLPNDPTIIERAKRFLGEHFNTIYELIRKKLSEILTERQLKFRRGGYIALAGNTLVTLTNFILNQVVSAAAPIVGNAIDIARGICQAIVAAKDRITAHQSRSMFVISAGHPLQIGRAIETQMNWAIGKGIYNAAKGGAKLAGNLASWGASALFDVIAACLELAYKFITRLLEGNAMRSWIELVKQHTRNRNEWKADPNGGVWRPGIVYRDKEFKSLFESGCMSSVCVPMLTLNSGITGDLMMFTKMFDDTGGILGQGTGIGSNGDKPSDGAQAKFNAAEAYWTQMKEWGRNYLESTGFKFTSTDKVAKGLMWHAIHDHQGGPTSTGDKVLSFLAGS